MTLAARKDWPAENMRGIVSAMSGTFTSFLRYEFTVFPLFITLSGVRYSI